MIKAIIFDCFGVVITDTLESAYTSLGGDFQKDLPMIKEILLRSDRGEIRSSMPLMAKLLGVSESTYATAISSGRLVDQDLLDYINDVLRKEYKVAMLSNVGKYRLPQIFGEGFLEKYFDLVVASGKIGYAKPEASAYEYVAENLGVRLDECVFTDDRPEFIEGAIAVGMKAIQYEDLGKFKIDLEAILS
jgi:FMN phosphatase YigB (HAD superfamily)